ALVQHHIPTEIHIFEKGGHGLSLGTRLTGSADGSWTQSEVAVWPQLVHTWMESWIAGAR
ncbi:MAG: alpha/beta hydrolase, partial [Lachnospiraceae bacterium]|nr:alpha/beta hydrolase [Lachnospiraceae bacterium]